MSAPRRRTPAPAGEGRGEGVRLGAERGESLTLLRLAPLSERGAAVFEAALSSYCLSLSRFRLDDQSGEWQIEALPRVEALDALDLALALAAAVSGEQPVRESLPVPRGGWLARNRRTFPPLVVGRRFLISPTHHPVPPGGGRIVIRLDAGLAFGSGEHPSTRGVLRALETLKRRPCRIVDLGTGSGILALAAIRLWHRRVLVSDLDPVSVRVARANARLNRLGPWLEGVVSEGWRARRLRRAGGWDLVMANILARPLMAMAHALALHLAPGGWRFSPACSPVRSGRCSPLIAATVWSSFAVSGKGTGGLSCCGGAGAGQHRARDDEPGGEPERE